MEFFVDYEQAHRIPEATSAAPENRGDWIDGGRPSKGASEIREWRIWMALDRHPVLCTLLVVFGGAAAASGCMLGQETGPSQVAG